MSKPYKRRDSVTAILRKMGINKSDYSKFIMEDENGYHLNMDPGNGVPVVAIEQAKAVKKAVAKKEAKEKARAEAKPSRSSMPEQNHMPVKSKKVTKSSKVAKVVYEDYSTKVRQPYRKNTDNITNVCRDLIKQGKTNEEVWVVIKEKFDLDDKKRTYPSWYRSRMRSAGEI
jgi:hypothetical protein